MLDSFTEESKVYRSTRYVFIFNCDDKGLIKLAVAGSQEIFKQHLIEKEEQPLFSKIYSAHFGAVSTM